MGLCTKHQLKFKRKLLLLINITNRELWFKQQPVFHIQQERRKAFSF